MPREFPIGTCAHCENTRPLKYARGTMCATYKCQRAAAMAVAARSRTTAVHATEGGSNGKEKMPVFCYEIYSVYGMRDCDVSRVVGKKRRNELADEDKVVSILVLGLFAESTTMTMASRTHAA